MREIYILRKHPRIMELAAQYFAGVCTIRSTSYIKEEPL